MTKQNETPQYDCLSHLWGLLTAREYNYWINTDDDEITATPLRQGLCDVLEVYLKFIDEVGEDWDTLFADLMGWDIVLEDFYNNCVKGQFTPYDYEWYNVNIEEWKYWQKYKEMNEDKEPLVPMPKSDKTVKVKVEALEPVEISGTILPLTARTKEELDELLTAVYERTESDFETSIEALSLKCKTEVFNVYDSSMFPSVVKIRLDIWKRFIVDLTNDYELSLTTPEAVREVIVDKYCRYFKIK